MGTEFFNRCGNPVSFDLEGQRFVITGAGRGIGKAIGKRFAELGARVSCMGLKFSRNLPQILLLNIVYKWM
jgi:short-subunit dehydrogenase involved in D-alanine esterification of teichoic acids